MIFPAFTPIRHTPWAIFSHVRWRFVSHHASQCPSNHVDTCRCERYPAIMPATGMHNASQKCVSSGKDQRRPMEYSGTTHPIKSNILARTSPVQNRVSSFFAEVRKYREYQTAIVAVVHGRNAANFDSTGVIVG